MAHLRVTPTPLSYFSFHFFHVSSVVGAPWRCGVLTTKGGLGWATYLGESMVQLTRVGWKLLAC